MSVNQQTITNNATEGSKTDNTNSSVNDIEQKIIKITAEILKMDINKIALESSFVDDLGADSLDQVELMMAYDTECGIEIPDEEASKIVNIADAVNYIKNKLAS